MTKQHTTSEQEFIELARNSHLFGCAEVQVDNAKACGQHQDELIQAHREAVQAAEVALIKRIYSRANELAWTVKGLKGAAQIPVECYDQAMQEELAARSHNGGKHEEVTPRSQPDSIEQQVRELLVDMTHTGAHWDCEDDSCMEKSVLLEGEQALLKLIQQAQVEALETLYYTIY